jgi:hypothetical protein
MGNIRIPEPAKLFVGVLTSLPELLPQAEERLTALLGVVDSRSRLFPFNQTEYYDRSMGSPIQRCFLSFSELIDASSIAAVKIKTNEMEAAFCSACPGVQRPINLDPGYLEQSKIVLASTKNFSHRILVSGGIYAEVTLQFRDGCWQSFPWTFPDFRESQYHSYFSGLRDLYREQLSTLGIRVRFRRDRM